MRGLREEALSALLGRRDAHTQETKVALGKYSKLTKAEIPNVGKMRVVSR